MTIKPVTSIPSRSAKYDPLPADVQDELGKGSGPCYATKYYGVVVTNQIGELQLHPCGCGSVFIFNEKYGWLYIKDGSPLRERAAQVIKQGVEQGMWRPETEFRI